MERSKKSSRNVYLGIPYLLPKTAYQSDVTGENNNLVLPLKEITLYIELF